MTTTITHRYHQLTDQRAYARRVKAFGLPALLAPYSQKAIVRLPSQRSAA